MLASVLSHRGCIKIAMLRWLSPSRCLQACCRTASAWGFRFSGGCVGAVSDKCVVAPRLHRDCDAQAAASTPLRAYCRTASAWRLRFSGGCVEAVAYTRLVCATRRFKLDGCRANFFASFDPLGGPWSSVCMPRENGKGQQWPRRCWGEVFVRSSLVCVPRRFEFDSRHMNFFAGFHFLCGRCCLVCDSMQLRPRPEPQPLSRNCCCSKLPSKPPKVILTRSCKRPEHRHT